VNDITAQLDRLRDAGLYRRTRLISGRRGRA